MATLLWSEFKEGEDKTSYARGAAVYAVTSAAYGLYRTRECRNKMNSGLGRLDWVYVLGVLAAYQIHQNINDVRDAVKDLEDKLPY